MGFDWDQYEESHPDEIGGDRAPASQPFDWDQFQEVKQAAPSMLESGARGAAQGATLGFADEIAGASGAAKKALTNMSTRDLVANYILARDRYRAGDKAAKDANPTTYGAGELGGGVASMFIPGVGLARGATAAKMAAHAIATGAAQGVGSSEADNVEGLVGDAALGAGFGAAGAGAGTLAARVIPGAKKTAEYAERKAVEHLRPTPKVAEIYGPEKLRSIGRTALNSGAIEFGTKAGNTAGNLEKLSQEVGPIVDDFIQRATKEGRMSNPQEIAAKFQEEVIDPLKKASANSDVVAKLEQQKKDFLTHYGARFDEESGKMLADAPNITPQQIEEEKRAVQNNINYLTHPSKTAQEAQRDWASALREAGENAVNDKGFIDAKREYGNLQRAQQMVDRTAGLTDSGTGLLGHLYDIGAADMAVDAALKGDPASAAVIGSARALARGRTASALAVGADKTAKFLEAHPYLDKAMSATESLVRQGTPTAFRQAPEYTRQDNNPHDSEVVMNKLSSNPNGMRYASVLAQAQSRGDEAYRTTYFTLQQTDPEFRKLMNEGD